MPRTTLPLSKPYYIDNEIAYERLLLNTDFDLNRYTEVVHETKNFPNSNFAILRAGGMNAFVKYGLNGPSHAHPDLINLEIMYKNYRISRDLSNPGYVAGLCNEWHKTSLAHNTVIRNGEEEAVFDYVFHLESEIKIENDYVCEPAELGYTSSGYQHVLEVNRVLTKSKAITFTGKVEDLNIRMVLCLNNKELYILKTMDNPVNITRTTFLLREKGKDVKYNLRLEMEE